MKPHNVLRLRHIQRQVEKHAEALEKHKKKGPLFRAAVERLQAITEVSK